MNTPPNIRNEQGQTMVEFALVMPLLAVLLLGVIQFGIAFNNYLTLTDAVRAGARQAAVSRHLTSPVTVTKDLVTAAADGMKTPPLTIAVTAPDGSAPSWVAGANVKVSATYPYSINLLGYVVASGTMSSATVERVE